MPFFDREGDFNYDIKFKEATRESPLLTEKAEKLKKDGYAINHARVRLGSGREVFVEGKKLLQSWGYSFASILQYLIHHVSELWKDGILPIFNLIFFVDLHHF